MSTPREPIPSDFRIHAANFIVGMKEFRFRRDDDERGKPGALAAEIIAEAAPLADWLEHGDPTDATQPKPDEPKERP